MSKHVSEWLNAYHDGELHGSQRQHVEAHLLECEVCQTELESLAGLSSLLAEVPTPEFTSPERFATQVSLFLPHKQVTTSAPANRVLEMGWWLVPVGLLGIWVFVSTSFWVGDLLVAANNLGLLAGASGWLNLNTANVADVSATLGQFGVLSGNSLDWASSLEAMTRISLPQIILHVSIALLYLSWMAIWWARRANKGHGQLLEG